MLGSDVRRVERMAQREEIPCQKVGGQYRFNRAEITEWLQRTMGDMSHGDLADVEAGIMAQRQRDIDEAVIAPLLRREAVSPHLPARTKNGVLRDLVALAEQTGLVRDSRALLDAVIAREELCSTAIIGKIAIPHPRRPLPEAIEEPILVVAKTSTGIVFGAPEARLTSLFFLTASQDDRHHLHILARLCRMLRDDRFVDRLEAAETTDEMIELMNDREARVICESQ